MVPRLRHRIGIETLRRELEAVHASSAAANQHTKITPSFISSPPASTSLLAVDEYIWAGNDSPYECTNGSNHKHHNAAVGEYIPGYRTSAAFLSSLRTNLRLQASPPPSPMSTPPSMRASAASLTGVPEPSPLAGDLATLTPPQTPTNPLDGVPDLSTYVTEDEEEKVAALKLVADSIAQMRQTASRIIIFHPLNMAIFTAFLAIVCNYLYESRSDTGIVLTTAGGITMAGLVFVRWLTGGYLFAAEEFAEKEKVIDLLIDADILVTKYGQEVIGAVILDWKGVEPSKATSSPKDSRQKDKRRKWRAEVKGWAVRIRYRGKGIGGDLLEEAVKLAKSKGAESVTFADDHANSKRILWDLYNAPFEKKERLGRDKLQALWQANPKGKKR